MFLSHVTTIHLNIACPLLSRPVLTRFNVARVFPGSSNPGRLIVGLVTGFRSSGLTVIQSFYRLEFTLNLFHGLLLHSTMVFGISVLSLGFLMWPGLRVCGGIGLLAYFFHSLSTGNHFLWCGFYQPASCAHCCVKTFVYTLCVYTVKPDGNTAFSC